MVNTMELLMKNLPRPLVLETGEEINVNWYDELAQSETDYLPQGIVRMAGRRTLAQNLIIERGETTQDVVESITYDNTKSEYQVKERDIVSITSLTGFIDGAAYTFEVNLDFVVGQSDHYDTPDKIIWLNNEHPDHNTLFTITYKRRLLVIKKADYFVTTFAIMLKARDMAADATLNPPHTARIASRLMEELLEALDTKLSSLRGQALDALKGISISAHRNFGMMSAHEGEGFVRGMLEIDVHRRKVYDGTSSKTIGAIEATVDIVGEDEVAVVPPNNEPAGVWDSTVWTDNTKVWDT